MAEEIQKRQLSKQDAIRHLIHGAIRLFMSGEDPFIIHMLIQSADKLLIDVAEKSGKKLAHDWETFIRPEKKTFFFTKYRETYNFFKHANHDFGKDLPVKDIVKLNLITLFVAVQNYFGLYGSITGHMSLHNLFVQCTIPDIFKMNAMPKDQAEKYAKLLKSLDTTTPSEFFSIVSEYIDVFAPTYKKERAEDLQENTGFFAATFADLHKQDTEITK
jgi:hypothetical protein